MIIKKRLVMEVIDWISIITGVASIVLAVVSLFISFKFYKWNATSNEQMKTTELKIAEKTDYLGKLFDKMFDSTFNLVKSQNEAMQRKLFSPSIENNEVLNYELEIYTTIIRNKQISLSALLEQYKIGRDRVNNILTKLEHKGCIHVENEMVHSVEHNDPSVSQSNQTSASK